jgi:hypothetical protein
MRGVTGLIGLLIVVGIGLFVYKTYFTAGSGAATMGTNNPRAAADITGVKNDLLAMAQAERQNQVLNGRYATLEELHSSGDLVVDPARTRGGYSYSAEISSGHFTISATYSGPATGMPTLSIDESMQIASR